jgi:hypothetical protein
MSFEPFTDVRVWSFTLVFLGLMLLSGEIGFRLGLRSRARGEEDTQTWIAAMEGAMLGVLALLLGFTMAMAVTRFDARRLLVVDEANAIGTSYLRTQLVPPPDGPEMAGLFREYVDARLEFAHAGNNVRAIQKARDRSARLQAEIWSRGTAFARQDRSALSLLLLSSLNQTFDLENSNWAAFNAHVPESVLLINALVAVLASSLVGYSFGLGGSRNPFTMCWLALCVTLVLAVIIDLDQPKKGLIRVSEQPLIDLQRQMSVPQR